METRDTIPLANMLLSGGRMAVVRGMRAVRTNGAVRMMATVDDAPTAAAIAGLQADFK